MEKIGLIAGNRRFPIVFSESAKKKNCQIVAVAIKGDTSPILTKYVDKIYWIKTYEFSKIFDIFKKEGIKKIAMAGQITPTRMFCQDINKDPYLKEIFNNLEDRKADTIFGAIAGRLKKEGFEVLDSTIFMDEFLPKKGTLTRTAPDFSQWEDIYFGFRLAKGIALLDIGQTVAVKHKAVVAVEALEGTDALIRRAGKIAGRGIIVVKVSKPHQDMRFDIPVIGLNTIRNLMKVKATGLAIEAGKTLFLDKDDAIKLADKNGIFIVAV